MKITGKIKFIDETKTYGNNGFQKRELIVTTNDDYPQPICIEFVQDKCTLLDNYSVGHLTSMFSFINLNLFCFF